jgi:N-acetylglucosaminyl-diphospho-decaprenol L-rhamnosyltransferase
VLNDSAAVASADAQGPPVAIDVSVITVSYQSHDELVGLLGSLDANPAACTMEILVADNASTDGTEEFLKTSYPGIHFIQIGYNSGFSTANNAAIASARGRYLFLLNPDTRVTEGCIDTLVAFMDAHPDITAAGPKLLNRDMSLQYSIRNLPSLRGSMVEAAFLHRLFPRLLARLGEVVYDDSMYESARPVGWVSGAAMFVRRSSLERIGLLDETFFLFSEEIDWFKRMHDAGVPVWFVPDATVIHRDDKGARNPKLMRIDVDSRRLYWKKHASPFGAALSMTVLGANMTIRYVLWSAIALSRSPHAVQQRDAFAEGLKALTPRGRPPRPMPGPDAGHLSDSERA